jgi:hypothetical protein
MMRCIWVSGILQKRIGGCLLLALARTAEKTFTSREKDGFTCYDLERNSTTLQVLPCDFLPEKLCACLPGWNGTGAQCTKCPENTFKPKEGAGSCTQCPSNTSTRGKLGSISLDNCLCKKAFHKHKGGKVVDARLDLAFVRGQGVDRDTSLKWSLC